jgi:hypothetical protein
MPRIRGSHLAVLLPVIYSWRGSIAVSFQMLKRLPQLLTGASDLLRRPPLPRSSQVSVSGCFCISHIQSIQSTSLVAVLPLSSRVLLPSRDEVLSCVRASLPLSRSTAYLPPSSSWPPATGLAMGCFHESSLKHSCQLTEQENLAELACSVVRLGLCSEVRFPLPAVVCAIFPIISAMVISICSLIRKTGAWNWTYLESR